MGHCRWVFLRVPLLPPIPYLPIIHPNRKYSSRQNEYGCLQEQRLMISLSSAKKFTESRARVHSFKSLKLCTELLKCKQSFIFGFTDMRGSSYSPERSEVTCKDTLN